MTKPALQSLDVVHQGSFITCALAAHDSRGRRSEPWTVKRFDEHIERKHHRAAQPNRDQDPKEPHGRICFDCGRFALVLDAGATLAPARHKIAQVSRAEIWCDCSVHSLLQPSLEWVCHGEGLSLAQDV